MVRTVSRAAFLWRILQHALPKGFQRSRNYGFLHPNGKGLIALLQLLVFRQPVRAAEAATPRTQLFRMCGVDLTRIDGIDVTTALAVISETGADMSRLASAAHFASWLGLCPGTRITGGKVMS